MIALLGNKNEFALSNCKKRPQRHSITHLAAMSETQRRREKQAQYNEEKGITPKTIHKSVADIMEGAGVVVGRGKKGKRTQAPNEDGAQELALAVEGGDPVAVGKELKALEKKMLAFAQQLDFEKAAQVRDQINALKKRHFL